MVEPQTQPRLLIPWSGSSFWREHWGIGGAVMEKVEADGEVEVFEGVVIVMGCEVVLEDALLDVISVVKLRESSLLKLSVVVVSPLAALEEVVGLRESVWLKLPVAVVFASLVVVAFASPRIPSITEKMNL